MRERSWAGSGPGQCKSKLQGIWAESKLENQKIGAIERRGWALTTTLRTPSRQLPQVGLKKEQPCQNFPLPAFPADALSRVTEN